METCLVFGKSFGRSRSRQMSKRQFACGSCRYVCCKYCRREWWPRGAFGQVCLLRWQQHQSYQWDQWSRYQDTEGQRHTRQRRHLYPGASSSLNIRPEVISKREATLLNDEVRQLLCVSCLTWRGHPEGWCQETRIGQVTRLHSGHSKR